MRCIHSKISVREEAWSTTSAMSSAHFIGLAIPKPSPTTNRFNSAKESFASIGTQICTNLNRLFWVQREEFMSAWRYEMIPISADALCCNNYARETAGRMKAHLWSKLCLRAMTRMISPNDLRPIIIKSILAEATFANSAMKFLRFRFEASPPWNNRSHLCLLTPSFL